MSRGLAATSFYEFEDLISDWMDADILGPPDLPHNLRRKTQTFLHDTFGPGPMVNALSSPALGSRKLGRRVEFAFALILNTALTYKLTDYKDLRRRSDIFACYIPEVWVKLISERPYHMAALRDCDHIFVSTRHSVEKVAEFTGRPCSFLPFGVDAVKFSPYPHLPPRAIDVLNIGRRSPQTHAALTHAAATSDFFYVHDTIAGREFIDAVDHRLYYANAAKRSQFFVANTANFDEAWKTAGAVEIGHRYYEAAAAGAAIIGSCPMDHPTMRADFDWADSVFQTPYHAPDIIERLEAFRAEPARLERARRVSVQQSLLRHDFVYRWATVLKTLGLDVTPKMAQRMTRLKVMATMAEDGRRPEASARSPVTDASVTDASGDDATGDDATADDEANGDGGARRRGGAGADPASSATEIAAAAPGDGSHA